MNDFTSFLDSNLGLAMLEDSSRSEQAGCTRFSISGDFIEINPNAILIIHLLQLGCTEFMRTISAFDFLCNCRSGLKRCEGPIWIWIWILQSDRSLCE